MGVLDELLGGLTGQPAGGQRGNTLLDLATAVIQGHPGGLAGLLQQFTAAGLDREASSWVSTGQNLPLSAEQLAQVLGQGNVRTLGEKFNLSQESASSGLASLLPALIDHLTPKGQVDPETPLSGSLNALRGRYTV
jgi:uncharacterized protein YidB (DUF937 family)